MLPPERNAYISGNLSTPTHSDFQPLSMWQLHLLRFALALCAIAAVQAVISPKVFIIDFVRTRSPVASSDSEITDRESNAV